MPKLLLLSTILLFVGCCGDKQDKQEQNMSITVNLNFLRDHKRFPEDITQAVTQAVERLENML